MWYGISNKNIRKLPRKQAEIKLFIVHVQLLFGVFFQLTLSAKRWFSYIVGIRQNFDSYGVLSLFAQHIRMDPVEELLDWKLSVIQYYEIIRFDNLLNFILNDVDNMTGI
jgi:hypothetical protein